MPTPAPYGVATIGATGAPAVLLLHPWWGVTDAVRWWAEQLAAAGRRVVVPDLYGGEVATTIPEAQALQAAMELPAALAFVERCADALTAENDPWAAVGFSMGAASACHLAGRGAAGPHDVVLFYGGWTPRDADMRTRHADLHVVPDDPWFEDHELAAVERLFREAGTDVTVHRYEGCGHWFAEAGSPGYDATAANLALERVVDRLGTGAR